jgi:hydroxymethylpyrimidine pyrophosphatase-like HAD family hydrolase
VSYQALATDYDGTLAYRGRVDAAAVKALNALKAAGWKLLLVSGRHLETLAEIFPELCLFDRVVAENGAVVAGDGRVELQGSPPPAGFLTALKERRLDFNTGRVMVDTVVENESAVKAAIAESGAALRLSRNKGALMVLPDGVDKRSGLLAALRELRLMPATTVGVGDAENDLPFLAVCGLAVACGDALPEVRAQAQRYVRNVPELVRELLRR